jgi:hypothetical protein
MAAPGRGGRALASEGTGAGMGEGAQAPMHAWTAGVAIIG